MTVSRGSTRSPSCRARTSRSVQANPPVRLCAQDGDRLVHAAQPCRLLLEHLHGHTWVAAGRGEHVARADEVTCPSSSPPASDRPAAGSAPAERGPGDGAVAVAMPAGVMPCGIVATDITTSRFAGSRVRGPLAPVGRAGRVGSDGPRRRRRSTRPRAWSRASTDLRLSRCACARCRSGSPRSGSSCRSLPGHRRRYRCLGSRAHRINRRERAAPGILVVVDEHPAMRPLGDLVPRRHQLRVPGRELHGQGFGKGPTSSARGHAWAAGTRGVRGSRLV